MAWEMSVNEALKFVLSVMGSLKGYEQGKHMI